MAKKEAINVARVTAHFDDVDVSVLIGIMGNVGSTLKHALYRLHQNKVKLL